MKKIFLAIVSSLSGLLLILGLFFPGTILDRIRIFILDWAIIVGAIALAIAIINLLSVHWNKVFTNEKRDYASPFFIVGFITVILIGILLGPNNQFFVNLASTTIITVEASLSAVLALTLSLASFRFFTKKQNFLAIVFGISTVIFLLLFSGILSLGENIPLIKALNNALNSLPIAGSTGILIGISLGAILTSLRIIFGFDRPYDRN
ncbi:MAG: hypothetical protein CVU41_01285 [Chloroflexi bacterium HGW-Chloroflexi-3]|nr:MAG: hypothetical protein CVU41_01285 [Chloroflexi bacterium HGW-Chloroflexi-3]